MNEQSLEQIEQQSWGDPPDGSSSLIATVHELRRKPIGHLTAEDLRVLLSQRVGVDTLMPLVLERLEKEPLLEGDFYPGDVLAAVLRISPEYWTGHLGQLAALERVLTGVTDPDPELARDITAFHERLRDG